MKSYQIIIGRDGTCDEDSDLEAQLWLQFPSRNCIHSPKPSLVHGWEASCSPVERKNPNPKRWRQESQKPFQTASKWHSNIVSQILTSIIIKTIYYVISKQSILRCQVPPRCLVSLAASFEDRSSRQRAAPASPVKVKQQPADASMMHHVTYTIRHIHMSYVFSSCLLFYQLKTDKYSIVMKIWQCCFSGVYPSWMPHWSPTVFCIFL